MSTIEQIFLSKVPAKLEQQRKAEAEAARRAEKDARQRAAVASKLAAEAKVLAAQIRAGEIDKAYALRARQLGRWSSAVSR